MPMVPVLLGEVRVTDTEGLSGAVLESGERRSVRAGVAVHAHVPRLGLAYARNDQLGQLWSSAEVAGIDDVDVRRFGEPGEVVLHTVQENAGRHVPGEGRH